VPVQLGSQCPYYSGIFGKEIRSSSAGAFDAHENQRTTHEKSPDVFHDSAKEFMLTGDDGSTWEVRSDKVALADHVGHKVTATGAVSNAKMHNMKEDAKDAAKDSGIKKTDAEHGHMTITCKDGQRILQATVAVGFNKWFYERPELTGPWFLLLHHKPLLQSCSKTLTNLEPTLSQT
jgi:hypothetical protein